MQPSSLFFIPRATTPPCAKRHHSLGQRGGHKSELARKVTDVEGAGNPMIAFADLDALPCFGGCGGGDATDQRNGMASGTSVRLRSARHIIFLSSSPVRLTRALLLPLADPSPNHVTITTTPPPQTSAHYGNQVLFQLLSFFFFCIISPTHQHTSLRVSPAHSISRDFPSNPSSALAEARVS